MTRSRSRFTLLAVAWLGLAPQAALADFTVSGRFLYTDREFTLGGFTGNEPNRPIRLADVQVYDATTSQVLASGATNSTGNFSIFVVDNQTRNIGVRVLASSVNTPNLFLAVRDASTNAIFAMTHPTGFPSHAPTTNINFTSTPIVAAPSSTQSPVVARAGDPFNIFDTVLDGLDFVAARQGTRPGASQSLNVYWRVGNMNGTYYNHATRSIYLYGLSNDSDGYDDSVILHEVGHYVEFNLADSDNPGDEHFPRDCYTQQLAWSEGYATFFQNMVRQHLTLSRPEIYIDTDGSPGPGGAFISYGVEAITFPFSPGSGNEASVNAALWDIVDTAATPDGSPGSDDDALQIADGPARFWDVHVNFVRLASTISIEDFWDGWFARGNTFTSQMAAIFAAYAMQFVDDAFENDDSAASARIISTGGTTHHTLYGVGDLDWTRFPGVIGGKYTVTATNLPCGSGVNLELRDDNATTILQSNPTTVSWTATKNANLYVRVNRPGPDTYANYDLTFEFLVSVAVSDLSAHATADGILLTWRAENPSSSFSHFDVERAAAAAGPFTRINTEAVVEGAEPGHYAYLDPTVEARTTYWYRLVSVDAEGSQVFGPIEVSSVAPTRLVLYPAQPNPFNPSTLLQVDVPSPGPVFLRVYDITGRLVRTLEGGRTLSPGARSYTWDGRDDAARGVASGVYIVRLESLGRGDAQRIVLVR
jgi:hypothetical protein